MTHGCGAMSSGGGGGGGISSAMSATVIAGAYHSGRRNSRTSNSDECCCAFCWLIAFLLCMVKMTPKTRIVLTWIWVAVAAVTAGVLVHSHTFADQSLTDSPWDMREVEGLSSTFCSSVTVDASSGMNTYQLPWSPPAIAALRRENSKSYTSYILYRNYEYWGFYFIEGSSVDVAVAGSGSCFLFYVIKGESDLNKWIDNSDCVDCYMSMSGVCVGDIPYTASFNFSDTDQYYFLFSNSYFVAAGISIDVTFDLNRKYYDVTSGIMMCGNENHCEVDLDLGADFSFIIEAPRYGPNDVDVTVTCIPRTYVYVLVFGMVPGLIGIGISLGIYKYSKRGVTTNSRRGRSDSRTRIYTVEAGELNSVQNRNYGMQPPGYMDKPPTYEESVGSTGQTV